MIPKNQNQVALCKVVLNVTWFLFSSVVDGGPFFFSASHLNDVFVQASVCMYRMDRNDDEEAEALVLVTSEFENALTYDPESSRIFQLLH